MRRVDFQVNGLSVDALVGAGNSRRLILDFSLDIYEIGVSSIGDVVELGPFSAARSSRRAVGVVVGIGAWLVVLYDVDELKDQRSSSHNAAASRQKVAADDVLEDGRFSGGLGSHDDLSGGALAASGETRIGELQPRTICGRSSESLPMVLNTRSCSLLTVESRSSPRAAIAAASWEPFLFFFCSRIDLDAA